MPLSCEHRGYIEQTDSIAIDGYVVTSGEQRESATHPYLGGGYIYTQGGGGGTLINQSIKKSPPPFGCLEHWDHCTLFFTSEDR